MKCGERRERKVRKLKKKKKKANRNVIETGKEGAGKPKRIHSRLIAETVKTWSMISAACVNLLTKWGDDTTSRKEVLGNSR